MRYFEIKDTIIEKDHQKKAILDGILRQPHLNTLKLISTNIIESSFISKIKLGYCSALTHLHLDSIGPDMFKLALLILKFIGKQLKTLVLKGNNESAKSLRLLLDQLNPEMLTHLDL